MAYYRNAAGQVVDDAGNVIFDPKTGGYDPLAHPAGSAPPPPAGVTAEDLQYIRDWAIPVQYDPVKKLSYTTSYSGARNYIPDPSVTPKPNTTFVHGPANWDPLTGTYKQGLNGGGLLGMIEGAGALAAGSGGFGLLGGAGGSGEGTAAGGVLPSQSLASVPGMTAAAPSVAGAAQTAAGAGALASTPLGGYGAAPSVANAAQTATTSALGGNSVMNALTSANGLTSLASLIPALIAHANVGGGAPGGSGNVNDLVTQAFQDARNTNAMETARYRRVDPLQQAVTQLAFSRLPTSATQGITLQSVPLPPQTK